MALLVSPRRPKGPASLATRTTDFAPGLAGSRSLLSIADRDLIVPKSGGGDPARTPDGALAIPSGGVPGRAPARGARGATSGRAPARGARGATSGRTPAR